MLIEFVSKTADGRTAAPHGNRGCAHWAGEHAQRRKGREAGDKYHLPFLLSPFFLSLGVSFFSYNSSISLTLILLPFLSRFLSAPVSFVLSTW